MTEHCYHCALVHDDEADRGPAEIEAYWLDTDGSLSADVFSVCRECLSQTPRGGPGYVRAIGETP